MLSVEETLGKILAQVRPRAPRALPVREAVDRFATTDLFAQTPLPPFDNSAMDGYAVVAAACTLGGRLEVVGEQPAGRALGLTVRAGEAVRIFTGAPVPAGADAVIMQEETEPGSGGITLLGEVTTGDLIRRRGGDVAEGQRLIGTGERIGVQISALLAAQGISSVQVGGEIRAAIISTGDEIAQPGRALEPGQIYDSNTVLLEGLLRKCGVKVTSLVHCRDRAEEIEAALRSGAECDVMIISGGVSVGARDLVKPALSAVGATVDLWRVSVKPGRPFLFGHCGDCAIFGLPGNPVSAFVTFHLFVQPAVLKMMGAADESLLLRQVPARLGARVQNDGSRPHYLRGRLTTGVFAPVGLQESHALFGLSRSNALLRIEAGQTLAADSPVTPFLLD